MSLGEIAYLGLVLTGFTAFAVVLFSLSIDDRKRVRRGAPAAAYAAPPSGGVKAHA
jgi:hypothetical protein